MTRTLRGVQLVAAMLALTGGTALAQTSGSISGKVTDSSGGVLPGVTVTASGPALQKPLVTMTQSSGAYSFPIVAIGTTTVTFELSGFKKVSRPGVIIVDKFDAKIDVTMEVGDMKAEVTVTAAPPVVDTKRVTTGGVFTKDILENIPTARDPWQVIRMAPGVTLSGNNVGGSSSGQQPTITSRGTSANVQWNLEGGSITDLSSNSSPSYFNFDSFEQIQVVTGGGDVSVQSSGVSINLTTKSGSNTFRGTSVFTFENDAMQSNNVSEALFNQSSSGFLSGSPLKKIDVWSIEYGGPIKKNMLWFWGAFDRQDINTGVLNYFDPTKSSFCAQLRAAQQLGTLTKTIQYSQLQDVQDCLFNDRTLIKNIEWKINYQLNAQNKFQWLFTSDNKYRNARGASATTAKESTTQQTSDAPWKLPLPMQSITHVWIPLDKLVFNNQFTYVGGGFFLDYQDYQACGGNSRYLGEPDPQAYIAQGRQSASCLWNVQRNVNRTTSYISASLDSSYATVRHSVELKTDGTYFVSKFLGGDHSLKFGVGYRRNPVQTFNHYSGGGTARSQCVDNITVNCTTQYVAPGSAKGLVPYQATIGRDFLLNNSWWTYNGYIQDQYSRGHLRLNGGLRYDWQTSKSLGGCDPANILLPAQLPAQCEAPTNINPTTGKPIKPFKNLGPRLSATYDLLGDGKTSIHASVSYYYQTISVLANSLNGLQRTANLTWGPNNSNGTCNANALIAVPTAGCWTDANRDGIIQVNELVGVPTSGNPAFNPATGIIGATGNVVDPSAKLGRTREAVIGASHELMANFAVHVDYTYRKYDRGTATYSVGFSPLEGETALSKLYSGPIAYRDPITGRSANYYIVCPTCTRPSGLTQTTLTNPNYEIYQGVDIAANKRFANRWQMNVALTVQTFPTYNRFIGNPTGVEWTQGISAAPPYIFKANGSYQLPYDIAVSANLNIVSGSAMTMSINGPGTVAGSGGVNADGTPGPDLSYATLTFQRQDAARGVPFKQIDLGVQKFIGLRGGKNRLTLLLDVFNVLNQDTVLSYSSTNQSQAASRSPSAIVPPRVVRVGARISF